MRRSPLGLLSLSLIFLGTTRVKQNTPIVVKIKPPVSTQLVQRFIDHNCRLYPLFNVTRAEITLYNGSARSNNNL